MTARVAASVEVLRHHIGVHRGAGCPSDGPDPTTCPRCDRALVVACSTCHLPLLIATTAPCTVNGEPGMRPYIPPTSGVAA